MITSVVVGVSDDAHCLCMSVFLVSTWSLPWCVASAVSIPQVGSTPRLLAPWTDRQIDSDRGGCHCGSSGVRTLLDDRRSPQVTALHALYCKQEVHPARLRLHFLWHIVPKMLRGIIMIMTRSVSSRACKTRKPLSEMCSHSWLDPQIRILHESRRCHDVCRFRAYLGT